MKELLDIVRKLSFVRVGGSAEEKRHCGKGGLFGPGRLSQRQT